MKKIDFKEMNKEQRMLWLINKAQVWARIMLKELEDEEQDFQDWALLWGKHYKQYSHYIQCYRLMHDYPRIKTTYLITENGMTFI